MIIRDFSDEFADWYADNHEKSVGDLLHFFREKSFAMLFILFMFIPALPVPTGGITTVLLLPGTMIASLQMMFGRRTLWLPKKITKIQLQQKTLRRAIPYMIKKIAWLEKYSKPRYSHILQEKLFKRVAGLCVFLLAIASFIAPAFSWLDTLPSFGAVLIALSLILNDLYFFIAGLVIGCAGVFLLIFSLNYIVVFFNFMLNSVQNFF